MRQGAPNAATDSAIVFVIDDDPAIRESIADLLGSVAIAVKTFASTQEFLHSVRPDIPACLVLDIRMPGLGGLDFQREMDKLDIQLPVIFITGHGDIPMSVKAMKAGAIEFLTKPFREQDLLDAIQAGLQKDRIRREETAGLTELRRRYHELGVRERDVMALVVQGLLNKQVAAALEVSEITVKVHRSQVMKKMQAASFADLVRMADKLGISSASQTKPAT
ncbi:MAG: response regulator transcription factor [Pseudomonadota bacterium]